MTGDSAFLSKILVPGHSNFTIRRDRVLERLTRDDRPPITSLVAPAGYGKTTLLIDIANEGIGDVSWLSLDEWDRDPVTFLTYLRSALSGESRSGARKREQTPTSLHDSLGKIVHRVEATGPRTLIIDDFHAVEDSAQVVDLVNYLAQRLPANMRLIIASRRTPSLASLPKLRLQNLAEDYGTMDLSFTREEIEEFYRARGVDVADAEIERVFRVTAGWPAGVALIPDPAAVEETVPMASGAIPDYLAMEVLGELPGDLKDFLLRTSVLEVLDGDACDWVLSARESEATLEFLTKSSIPMTHTGARRLEVRIHPLVRDFLRAELRSQDTSLYTALHVRAGERADSFGQHSEAISHHLEGENWSEVARLITQQAPGFYRLGRWHTIAAWLRAIPQSQLDEHPDLRWWEARILARLGQIDSALRVIGEAIPRASSQINVARFETLRASALRGKGDVSGALLAARRAFELSMEQNAPIDVVAEARKEFGLALFAEGSFGLAIVELRAALALRARRGNTEESAFINGCLGPALGAMGKLAESAEHLESARQQWQMVGNAKELSWVLNNLGITYQRIGQLELASDVLKQSIAKSRQSGNRRMEAYALESLAEIELTTGDTAAAHEKYQAAYEISAELGDDTALTHARCGLANCSGKMGDPDKGIALARQALASAQDRGSPFEQGLASSSLGRLLRQRGSLDDAVDVLSEAVSLFEQTASTYELAQTLLFLGDAALPLRGSRSLVRVSLERFVRLAESLGEAIYFLVSASEIEPLIEFGISRKIGGDLLREMLRRTRRVRGDGDVLRDSQQSRLPSIRTNALGAFEVSIDGRSVLNVEWESEKSKEMFLLLATAGRALTRDEIVSALWPEAGGQKATSAFHSTLHRLRRATYKEVITSAGGEYALNAEADLVSDVDAFKGGVEKSEAPQLDEADRLGHLRRAINLYRGGFALGFDSEWTNPLRVSLEEQFLRASLHLTEVLYDAGDYAAAVSTCERILEVDPFSESACHHLMKSHSAMGDVESALRAYRRFSESLEFELGELPGEALDRLHDEIRSLVGHSSRNLP